jgi:RHS repeat-associated protein
MVDHIIFAHNGTNVMTNQNTYDKLNRLTGISSASSVSSVVNFQYQYNAANQRTKVTLVDGSYWIYGYDALGQLTGARKYFWDGTPYAGQQYGFTFDTIGNRTGTQAGGDSSGLNLRQARYTNNALNQIVSRDVPGYVDVMGLSLATNTVKVNGTNAYQKWEYFREQLGTNNSNVPQWVGITVTASNQTTISGGEYLAQTPENFTYDLDGNQLSDGRFNYTWDGENRLISATSLTNAPVASKVSLAFTYDYMGRRIQKVVSTNNGTNWVVSYTNKFVYDGWNVVAILDGTNNLLYTFTWGTDLSGSMQGAGGVGGLLSITYCAPNAGTNAGTYFPCYDGNGNVVALVNATNGSFAGNWEYGPFGEVIRATGPMAKVNPFMFSTTFYDWETGLYYYGHRYYNPSTGRWLSRDPIGERGGKNLYCFLGNNPITSIDKNGRLTISYKSGGRKSCGSWDILWTVSWDAGDQPEYYVAKGTSDVSLVNCKTGIKSSDHQVWYEAILLPAYHGFTSSGTMVDEDSGMDDLHGKDINAHVVMEARLYEADLVEDEISQWGHQNYGSGSMLSIVTPPSPTPTFWNDSSIQIIGSARRETQLYWARCCSSCGLFNYNGQLKHIP